jgi:hypothetical protein
MFKAKMIKSWDEGLINISRLIKIRLDHDD